MPADPTSSEQRDALVERLFAAALGVNDLYLVHIGDRLGLYRALGSEGSMTSSELAAATGTQERYVREWLEHQAVGGLLEVADEGDALSRSYALPDGHAEVLLDRESEAYLAPFARMMVGIVRPLDQVLDAFRTGAGVAYAEYPADFCEGQGEMNRVSFVHGLAGWLGEMPEEDARLRSDPPARVADVACGTGFSTLEIARAYPKVTVDGLDLDPASIAVARANLEASGLADRVTFSRRDAADPGLSGRYDLVCVFEAIHDLSRPVEVLASLRGLLADGGSARRRRARRRLLHRPGGRRRAPHVRLERPALPARGHGRAAVGGDGHRHAGRHAEGVRARRRLHRGGRPAYRARVLALLPAGPVAPRGAAQPPRPADPRADPRPRPRAGGGGAAGRGRRRRVRAGGARRPPQAHRRALARDGDRRRAGGAAAG